jgi:DNA polymerase-1
MPRAPFTLAEDTDDLKHAMNRLAGRPLLALDLETSGLDPHGDRVVLISVGDDSTQLLVDCRKVSPEPLVPLLEGPVVKVTHNGAFDLAMLRSLGIRAENVLDTMLIEQVLNNGRGGGSRSLAALSERYLGVVLDKTERLGFGRASGAFSAAQLEYARRDILATYQILLEQMPRLSKDGLEDTARVECEAMPAFADLFYDGVYLDRQAWSKLIDEAGRERERLRGEIDSHLKKVASTDLFGRVDINLESEAELKAVLSKLLGKKVTDVNKASLKGIGHPVGAVLLKYRELNKIVSTYGESFLEAIHPKTGRIHADFQQIGAPTGRVACARPNLQNIPRGSRFRRCFCAPQGRRMVTADYSGCELRILAEMSDDPEFINTFQRGGDLHAIVASEIFSTPVAKDKNPELRDRAKAINFGLAYGMGPSGLAAVTGVGLAEAERLLKRYFRAYPKVKQFLDGSARTAVERGWTQTLGGRKLYLQIGERMEGADLAAITRVAKNMPIQGTNADMLKLAMAGIRHRLAESGLDAWMVNCVHDEILLEAEEGEAWDAADIVREEMVKAGERYVKKVPITVDVSVGDSWLK